MADQRVMETDAQARLEAAASLVEIQQLPVRYAQALDSRDLDALAEIWAPDVWMGKDCGAGPDGVRKRFEPILRRFYRSIHMIVGHKIDLIDADHARGEVYCRAEHESGPDWVVQAIVYNDEYRRVNGRWGFAQRRHHHWYSSPIDRAPTAPTFEDWAALGGPLPDLPHAWPTWAPFWERAGAEKRDAATEAPDAPAGAPVEPSIRAADKMEIHELAARYGFICDDREWDSLHKVFTDDAVFVIKRDGGENRYEGLAGIRSLMDPGNHPLAHHVTNVLVDGGPDNATMRSKVIASLPKGRTASADYLDKLRRTPAGWRISERIVTMRRAPAPEPDGA